MSDAARLLDEAADKLLTRHVPQIASERAAPGADGPLLAALVDSGLLLTLVPEAAGGLGGDLADAATLAWRWGYHAAPLPLVEMLLGERVAALAGLSLEGVVVLSDCGTAGPGGMTAVVPHLATDTAALAFWSGEAGDTGLARLETGAAEAFRDLSGAGWLLVAVQDGPHWTLPPGTAADLRQRGALLMASQMTGAMARIIETIVEHANTRQQFGRALGKFQAVQNLIADAASEQVVTQAAVGAAISAVDRGADQDLLTLSAKAQAGRAATIVAAHAHQVMGAMGFTNEHMLAQYSRRLWDWRDQWGRQSVCEQAIGRAAVLDPRGLWRHIVD